jgi:(E)-2-((N-methylformamido)methylene)succinate hydrolase
MAEVLDIDPGTIFAGGTRVLSAGDGVPVVFVHGVGMNADIWFEQLRWFSRGNRAIAYDMLNHGSAPGSPSARPGLDGYVDQLLEIADDLKLGRFHLVGHSMGALVATTFALAHPGRVRTLAAMNPVWRRDAESSAAVLRRAAELDGGLKATNDENAIARWFGTPIPADLVDAANLTRKVLAAIEPVAYARSYNLFARSDRALEETLPTLAMPALFITGELDPNSTPAMSEEMARIAPQGEAVVLPGERHMMSLTAPALVHEHLAALMKRGKP